MSTTYNYDWKNYDKGLMEEFNWFLYKVNERACLNLNFIDGEYQEVNRKGEYDPGLGRDVEYFHPTITLDDRMRYIGTVIAQQPLSEISVLGNTLISHFYGARGVHMAVTGSNDPLNCFVDFDKVADGDKAYIAQLRHNLDESKKKKMPIWGTTELHTSIQTASRNFTRKKYDQPEKAFHPVDVVEWVADFRNNGTLDGLLKAEHIKDAYTVLRKLPGIGEYYGFHGAASSSVLPIVKYHHDDRFVAPGPGAVYTIGQIWPNAPKKLYAEAIYFMRENAEEIGLIKDVDFHPKAYNIEKTDGTLLFPDQQDSLKYYGTEVMSCQFGIYLQIRNDPKACAKRKVARLEAK